MTIAAHPILFTGYARDHFVCCAPLYSQGRMRRHVVTRPHHEFRAESAETLSYRGGKPSGRPPEAS